MTNVTTSTEKSSATYGKVTYGKHPGDVTYTVRDVNPETGDTILAGPFVELEVARYHQQLHKGSRVFREELF